MRNLQNVIKDYLSKPTDFAIQITGNWGCGKTYYYRNVLKKDIEETATYDDARKNYKPIYISLFGLKSTDDIATKIVLDFFQSKYFGKYFTKTESSKKKFKITENILKIGFKGFLNFYSFGNSNDYITDIKNIGKEVLDTKELVVCFDDVERKDSRLKIQDLMGFMNNLIDEGTKVLIILNQDELLKKEEEYSIIKEKIIGISVEYVPDVEKTLNNILKNRYHTFPEYFGYLNSIIKDLLQISTISEHNFRHMTYALDILHNCYSIIQKEILDPKHEISGKLLKEKHDIFIMIIALAIEYKSSFLKYSDLPEYSTDYTSLENILYSGNTFFEDKNNPEKSKIDQFLTKYNFNQNRHRIYNSIFSYVTGYDEFRIDSFISEFKTIFNLEKGETLPQYELMDELCAPKWFSLTDKEYEQKTLELLEHAYVGDFSEGNYIGIMNLAERLNNILELNLDKVKNDLISGLKKAIRHSAQTLKLDVYQFSMSSAIEDLSPRQKELLQNGIKEIETIKSEEIQNDATDKANLFITNILEFKKQYQIDSDFKNHIIYNPILSLIDPKVLFEKIILSNVEELIFINYFFIKRYMEYNISKILKQEFENLQILTNYLTDYCNNSVINVDEKIKHHHIQEISNSLINTQQMAIQFLQKNNPSI